MNIQPGWLLYRADFTEQAFSPRPVTGTVVLIMDHRQRDFVRALYHDDFKGLGVFDWAAVTGDGTTFDEALEDANAKAEEICASISTTKLTATG